MRVEKNTLPPIITETIERKTGKKVISATTLTGGNVASTKRIVLSDGSQLAVKTGKPGTPATGAGNVLDVEGYMLTYLQEKTNLPSPKVIFASPNFLIIEYITIGGSFTKSVEENAAELLAGLHGITSKTYGFERDTLIGGLIQPNGPMEKWIPFFTERRILYMAKQALEAKKIDADMMDRIEAFAKKFPDLLDEPAQPSLIHGDIWSGNVLYKDGKIAAFVDPALYFADPDMEFVFATVYNTFGDTFFSRYKELRPIRPGFSERRDIYSLFSLLVHTCLFGNAYVLKIDSLLERFE